MQGIQLIVGLGNPGAQYEVTRHNAGFWWIDQVAAEHSCKLTAEGKLFGIAGRLKTPDHEAWLLKPTTFMNASGRSVAAIANFYKIPSEAVLVVHDELDLEPGSVKLKKGGGHGGHNGLRSIIDCLKTNEFIRLRIGIAPEHPVTNASDFVLGKFSKGEAETVEKVLRNSADAIRSVIRNGVDEAMAKYNGEL